MLRKSHQPGSYEYSRGLSNKTAEGHSNAESMPLMEEIKEFKTNKSKNNDRTDKSILAKSKKGIALREQSISPSLVYEQKQKQKFKNKGMLKIKYFYIMLHIIFYFSIIIFRYSMKRKKASYKYIFP